jgi:Flp pilus assembly pilin Flp
MIDEYIGRIVVLISPLIAGLSLLIVNAVQDWTGVNLDGTELTALLTAAVVGAFGLLGVWLKNRGDYEKLVETGSVVESSGRQLPKK